MTRNKLVRRTLTAACALVLVVGAATAARAESTRGYHPDDISIALERTTCLDKCPGYEVTVLGDGTVLYFGKSNVPATGSRKGRITTEEVAKLINEVFRSHFFESVDRYDGVETVSYQGNIYLSAWLEPQDQRTSYLTIKIGKNKHQVRLCYEYPSELAALADKIDEVTQSRQWTESK